MRRHASERHPHVGQSHRPAPRRQRGLTLFFRELKQRRVLQAAAIYLGGAIGAVQVIEFAFGSFDVPRVWSRVAILALVVGFPVTVVLAWLYELHPVTVRRERRMSAGPLSVTARRWAWGALAFVLVAVAAVGATVLWKDWREASRGKAAAIAGPGTDHVAVLYFSFDSPDSTWRYIAATLTETLIPHLAQMNRLTVISSAGVAPYREKPVPPDSLARVLHVGTVLTGAVTAERDSLHAQIQLVDARSNRALDSRSVDGSGAQSRQFVDRVVRQATSMLRERVGPAVQRLAWHAETNNDRAWELVHRGSDASYDGRLLISRGELSAARDALRRADSLYAAAEAEDPAWDEPLIQRGWLQHRISYVALVARDEQGRVAALGRGIAHADRALKRHPGDAAALELRGVLRFLRARYASPFPAARTAEELVAAEGDLRAALASDPHKPLAWATLSAMRYANQDYRAALLDARHAFEEESHALLQGTWPLETLFIACRSAFEVHDDGAARAWSQEMQAREPGGAIPALCALQLMAWAAGAPDVPAASALRNAARGREAPQADAVNVPAVELAYAAVLARAGLRDSAEAITARTHDPGRPDLLDREAEVRVLLGQHARAVGLLAQYLHAFPSRSASIRGSRRFAALRTRPDFARLFAGVGPERQAWHRRRGSSTWQHTGGLRPARAQLHDHVQTTPSFTSTQVSAGESASMYGDSCMNSTSMPRCARSRKTCSPHKTPSMRCFCGKMVTQSGWCSPRVELGSMCS